MSWLKKAGIILLRVTELVVGFGPQIAGATSTTKDDRIVQVLSNELTQIAAIITQVEAMAAALSQPVAGTEKLKMATPAVAQIILGSSIMARHEIADPALFKQGCASIASGMADVLNALKDNVDVVNKG